MSEHRTFIAAIITVGFLLAGCGGTATGSTSPAEQAGCASTQTQQTEELYVRELRTCDSDLLYIFNDQQARDDWRRVAESFGATIIKEGDTWLRVKK